MDTDPEEPAITLDEVIAVSAESEIATDSNPVTTVVPDEENLDTDPEEPAITLDEAIAVSAELRYHSCSR